MISCLSGSLTLLISSLLVNIIKSLDWNNYPKYIYLIFIQPFVTIFLLYDFNNYQMILANDKILMISLILLVLSNFIFIVVFINIINTTNKLNKLKTKEELTNLRYEYLTKL